jgi:hypothetical protein
MANYLVIVLLAQRARAGLVFSFLCFFERGFLLCDLVLKIVWKSRFKKSYSRLTLSDLFLDLNLSL